MKVLYIYPKRETYIRNKILKEAFLSSNFNLSECFVNYKSIFSYFHLIIKGIYSLVFSSYDIVVVGFFGQPFIFIYKLFSKGKPIVLDAFISSFNTLCVDRKKYKQKSLMGRFFFYLDKYSCMMADKVLLDTDQHIDYFCKTFGLSKNKFKRIFVGTDVDIFKPMIVSNDNFLVFTYGQYQPIHGVSFILKAAKLLANENIKFKIGGKGMLKMKALLLAKELELENVEFIDWVNYQLLPSEIARADVCLGGHFGDTEKARMVIAGKTYQFIAMKKPVIVSDNPANRELLNDKKDCVMINIADPEELANAILKLKRNKVFYNKIANGGYKTFNSKASYASISNELKKVFNELI